MPQGVFSPPAKQTYQNRIRTSPNSMKGPRRSETDGLRLHGIEACLASQAEPSAVVPPNSALSMSLGPDTAASEIWASDFSDGTATIITAGSPSTDFGLGEDSNAPAKPFAVIPPTAAQRISLEPFAVVPPMAAGQNSDQDAKEDNPPCKSEFHTYRQHNKSTNVFHYVSISLPLIYPQPVPNLQHDYNSCSTTLCGTDYCVDPLTMMSSPTMRTVHKLTISLPLANH